MGQQVMWFWDGSGIGRTICNCSSLQTDNHASTSSLNFCRLDARPNAQPRTHTHTFNDPLSGNTRVSRYLKGKTNLDFTEARDSEWQRMQVNHASNLPLSFLQAG